MTDEKEIQEIEDRILKLELIKEKFQLQIIRYKKFCVKVLIGIALAMLIIFLIGLYGMNMSHK